ncbi:M20 family metallopeptidase [Microvirga massiliensis]|uniref:M20 family metallopeptidase n=1 Tax=Microvirga massiliensis TaxID=1033741 RepID=UPI00062B4DD2|nr:ArgE/DapE family deacylase [Microvirga massiliensis]
MSVSSNRARLIASLERLVAIPTAYPPGDTTQLCAEIAPELTRLGYRVGVHKEVDGLENIVASIGEGTPHLVFNAHVDTVGVGDRGDWRTDPFVLTANGDRLYGLGASNCKGSMAVHLWVAEEIAKRGGPRRGTVTFTFVTDEESLGPHGMAYLRQAGLVKPTMLCLGAPTSNALITTERGVMWVAVETTGKAAHAGAPETGDNAIERMLRLIACLQRDLFPRIAARHEGEARSTVNLGQLQGGSNTNVVPSRCRLEIDRRLLPSESVERAYAEIVETLRASGEPEGSWSAELMRGTNGFASAADGELVAALAGAVEQVTGEPARFGTAIGASDGRYFADDGIEIVNFGPGGGSEGHAANEFVLASELETSAAIHLALVERLLGWRG